MRIAGESPRSWTGLALLASFLSIRFNLSVALVEILVGIAAGNLALFLDAHHVFGVLWSLSANEWIKFWPASAAFS